MLASSTIFFENAGGSLLPRHVIEAVDRYFRTSYVNFGAAYPESENATRTITDAHDFVRTLMGGDGLGEVIFGASCSQLLRMLADCYSMTWGPGLKVAIAITGHEANINPWVRLGHYEQEHGFWGIDPETFEPNLDELESLLRQGARIVVFPQVSNILGHVADVREVSDLAHRYGARVVVDGVAYASHSAPKVGEWGCDWYVYSTYKVYGPHMGALFGTRDALAELTGPNHFFVPKEEAPRKFELGNSNHEGCAAILGYREYLQFLSGRMDDGREMIETAYEVMEHFERPLTTRLLEYLSQKRGVRVVGKPNASPDRVGTISFVLESVPSSDISKVCTDAGIGLRSGHMYSYRLCEALGIDPAQGVVRASFVHYNTIEEVDRLIEVLERFLPG